MSINYEFDFFNVDPEDGIELEFSEIEGIEPSLYDRYEKLLSRYRAKFGRTFDDYLVSKSTDDVYEKAIALMEQALAGDREAVTNKDLDLPEYEDPDEFESPILY